MKGSQMNHTTCPTQKTTRRERISMVDGLARSERRKLYDPSLYTVERIKGLTFRVTHTQVPAEFTVTVAYGRFWYVTSNTGREYDLPGGACHCEDAKGRAQEEGRPCKHAAVCIAVSRFLRNEKAAA